MTKLLVVLSAAITIAAPAIAADKNPVQPAALGGAATVGADGDYIASYPEKGGCVKATVEKGVMIRYRWYYDASCSGKSDRTTLKLNINDPAGTSLIWQAEVSEPRWVSADEFSFRWVYNGEDNEVVLSRQQ